eukprot:2269206-Ditylum_brightwellii.AAC.1
MKQGQEKVNSLATKRLVNITVKINCIMCNSTNSSDCQYSHDDQEKIASIFVEREKQIHSFKYNFKAATDIHHTWKGILIIQSYCSN